MANDKAVKGNSDFGELEAMTKPRDIAWGNWAKWPTVGTEVVGYIRDVFYRPVEEVDGQEMKAQRALTIEQADGVLINVGIKYLPFVLSGTDDLRLGDVVKIVFSEEIPHEKKMYSAIKQFKFYGKKLPQNDGNKTVKELTLADMAAGGTKTPEMEVEPAIAPEDRVHAPKMDETNDGQAF